MKHVPLALCLVWAAPARSDVAVPQPAAKTNWAARCAARIDAAATKLHLKPGARVSVIPLLHENGTPNPVHYVEYAASNFTVKAGEEPESRPDRGWTKRDAEDSVDVVWFRRAHNHFAWLDGMMGTEFTLALNDCLQMGEAK